MADGRVMFLRWEYTDSAHYFSRVLMAMNPDAPLNEVLRDLLATSLGRSDWLLTYWSRETLFSVEARRAWVEPDLAPLPF